MDVSVPGPYLPPPPAPQGFIVHCPYFAVQEQRLGAATRIQPRQDRFELLIALEGSGRLGREPFHAGQVWHMPPGTAPFDIRPEAGAYFLRVFVP